jgi:pheromone shutdown protein TraB
VPFSSRSETRSSDVIANADRTYYLCGTAHISQDFALLVRQLIRTVRPDSVMIELDRPRFDALMAKSSAPTFDSPSAPPGAASAKSDESGDLHIFSGIWDDLRRGPGNLGERIKRAQSNAIGRSLSSLYKSMEEIGFETGDEFRVAATEALSSGAQLVLGDQDVRTTLDSLRDALGKTDLRALFAPPSPELSSLQGEYGLNAAQVTGGNLTNSDVQGIITMLKERENTRALVRTLRESTPELYGALIAQRDAYMARSLRGAKGKVIVAVVGMAHLDGIGRTLMEADATLALVPKRGCPAPPAAPANCWR